MLYLEDYIEMIEHLPQELRDRFSEMKELDYQVQNSLENLDKRVGTFFSNAKKMTATEKEAEFEAIRKEYYRSLEDADEKIALANNMSDLVGKYYRRLDQELHKFKMELEADNMGITEILEKRSSEKDIPGTNSISQKENRYSSVPPQRAYYGEKRIEGTSQALVALPKQSISQGIRPLDVVGGSSGTSSALGTHVSSNSQQIHGHSSNNYGLSHMGPSGRTAIAAAASQAIAATQQMQQGRRTASLKASYEAIGGVSIVGTTACASSAQEISKEIAGAAQTAIAAIQDSHKKHKANSSLSGSSTSSSVSRKTGLSQLVGAVSPVTSLPSPDTPTDRQDLVDPNEARYCICNEVAYGMMVACDNKTCPYEWYHYPCVGISEKPKGKWYCPHCTAAMKRNRNRK